MDTVTQLIVRACKSGNPYRRLHSVHRRFYLLTATPPDAVLAQKLASICDEHLNVRVMDLISDYHPDNRWLVGSEPGQGHWPVTVRILIRHIRDARADQFPGLRAPRMFRRRSAVLELTDE